MTDVPTQDRSASVPPAVAGASRRSPLWATLIATFFGIGRLRPGPGTWGSAATVLLWAALAHELNPASCAPPLLIALAVLVTLIGIPAATLVARASATKDPQFVVIDEVAGQLIALIAVPLHGKLFSWVLYFLEPSISSSHLQCANWSAFQKEPGSCSMMLRQEFTRSW